MNFLLLEPWNKDINAKKIVGLLAHYCLERYIRIMDVTVRVLFRLSFHNKLCLSLQ